LVNWDGRILLPVTTAVSGGNQWLAWRLLVVEHQAFALDSAVCHRVAGPVREILVAICNEMFHTWPPLVLGSWVVRSVDGPRVRGIVLAGPCKSGNGKYARG